MRKFKIIVYSSIINNFILVLIGAIAPVVLGNPIPPNPSKLPGQKETNIPDEKPKILIVNEENKGEKKETEVPKIPHPVTDSCKEEEITPLAATSSTDPSLEGQEVKKFEQDCLPIYQKFNTSAADLMLDESHNHAPSLSAPESPETDPTSAPIPENKEPADNSEQTVTDVENPLLDRISLPIVNRTAFGIGTFERTANATFIQPVLPIPLGENYLIFRPSLPLVYVPRSQRPQGGKYGLGDFRMQVYYVPKSTQRLTWGFGPTFLFPTASDRLLGFAKWGIGPAFVAVWSQEHLTVGGRIENYWSFAGDGSRRDVSQLTILPFITYVLNNDWYVLSSPSIIASWHIPKGEKWLVPIGGGIGKIMKLGDRPLNVSVQAYWHAVGPTNVEGWSVVVQFQSLFPQ